MSDQDPTAAHPHPPPDAATELLRAALRTTSLGIRATEHDAAGALVPIDAASDQLAQAVRLLRTQLRCEGGQ